jgi:5'-nucleotidase (lipoprotein e(P4) family)
MQTAVEYRAVALQAYRRAEAMLDGALADPNWTAALEQTGDFSHLPPAVVLDVDETVLDNSAYAARLVRRGIEFDIESWTAWCREVKATAVPGAREFTGHAADKGVTVFYVTNRHHDVEEDTRKNLEVLGFPLDSRQDTLYTRRETANWQSSDKGPRRMEIASRYRILLLIGDDLGDFVSVDRASIDERDVIDEEFRENWGTRWIMLPNPQYGSWEEALFGFDRGLTNDERLRLKYEALRAH